MSANVDLERSVFADWERGDFSRLIGLIPIELASPEGIDSGSWRGRGEVRAAWRDTLAAWDNLSVTAEEYDELDEERILVLHRFSARGKLSGLEVGEVLTGGGPVRRPWWQGHHARPLHEPGPRARGPRACAGVRRHRLVRRQRGIRSSGKLIIIG